MTNAMRRRAISPVVATIILISVSVALAIAVAYWTGGLTSLFSKYDQLKMKITTSYAYPANGTWTTVIGGTNMGTAGASIVGILINGIPIQTNNVTVTVPAGSSFPGVPVPPGSSFEVHLRLGDAGSTFISGQTVQITILASSGVRYDNEVNLP